MSNEGFLSSDIVQVDPAVIEASVHGFNSDIFREAYLSPSWSNVKVEDQCCIIVDRKLLFQICMIEDISRSKLSQVDEFEARLNPRKQMVDRIGSTKRKLISAIDVYSDESTVPSNEYGSTNNGNIIYKLTLQDKSGNMFFAINTEPIPALRTSMLGAKLVILPGAVFHRGVFMFTNSTHRTLFGLIPSWNVDKDLKILSYLEQKLANERKPRFSAEGKRKRQ